jgi:hypothetical protein
LEHHKSRGTQHPCCVASVEPRFGRPANVLSALLEHTYVALAIAIRTVRAVVVASKIFQHGVLRHSRDRQVKSSIDSLQNVPVRQWCSESRDRRRTIVFSSMPQSKKDALLNPPTLFSQIESFSHTQGGGTARTRGDRQTHSFSEIAMRIQCNNALASPSWTSSSSSVRGHQTRRPCTLKRIYVCIPRIPERTPPQRQNPVGGGV